MNREHTIGRLLETYRSRLNRVRTGRNRLTQKRLAQLVGVSPTSIRDWLLDATTPTAEHLMTLIEVYLREGAFLKGEEVREAVHLWEEANLNVTFDERWFRGLLHELSRTQEEQATNSFSKSIPNKPKVPLDTQEAMPPISLSEQYMQTYRENLRSDPRIAYIQILDMKRPLELLNVYVRLRIHEGTQLRYDTSLAQYTAVAKRDPNVMLRLDQQRQADFRYTALEPEEAIYAYRRCVIVGDPGAGKTTLLRYLTLKCAAQAFSELPDLPLYLELHTFASSAEHDLLDLVAAQWETLYGFPRVKAYEYIINQLEEGKGILFLDALDETVIGATPEAAEGSYTSVSGAILNLATRFRKAPIVVTVRKAGYQQRSPLVGFTELEILDFRPQDIRQFVTNWYRCSQDHHREQKAADLQMRLQQSQRIHALAANPLLLSLIVMVYEAQLDLPDRRSELYRRCVETLLTEWDRKRNIRRRREFTPGQKHQLLERVAWYFHQQGQRYFSEHDLLSVIVDFSPVVGLSADRSSHVLKEIANEHGLLKEQAHGWYGFLHLTLQEYFAAQYVISNQELEAFLPYRCDPWWEEVFLLYAGSTPDTSLLLHKLLSASGAVSGREDMFKTDLLLAGKCLEARPMILQTPLYTKTVIRLFEELQQSPYPFMQRKIADTLVNIGGREIIMKLVEQGTDPQVGHDLRAIIMSTLGSSREPTLAPMLMRLLADPQEDKHIRRMIANALGRLRNSSVVPEMMRLLADPQVDKDVRDRICDALIKLEEPDVVPEMMCLLTNPQVDKDVRGYAAFIVGKLGDQDVVPEMMRLLTNSQEDARVRSGLVGALGTLVERDVVNEPMRTSIVIPELIRLLTDPQENQKVRLYISHDLGSLGKRTIIPQIVDLLADPLLDMEVRMSLAHTLEELKKRTPPSELAQALVDPELDEEIRESLVVTLEKWGQQALTEDIIFLLTNPQLGEDVRKKIASTLSKWGERSISSKLVLLLTNPDVDQESCKHIVNILGSIGERSIVNDLVRLLHDPQLDLFMRLNIIKSLGGLGERSVVPYLVQLLAETHLKDRNDPVPGQIIQALRDIGDPSVIPMLFRLIRETPQEESGRRGSLVNVIGKLANDEAIVQELLQLLSDSKDIAEDIYVQLWHLCQRLRLKIFITSGTQREQYYETVPWDA